MLQYIGRFFSGKTKSTQIKSHPETFKNRFFSSMLHHWIVTDPILKRGIEMLIDSLDSYALNFFSEGKEIAFIRGGGGYASALSALPDYHVIIIYPELIKLLRSGSPTHGVAILAHELGHLIYGHSKRSLSNLDAQMEADAFAAKMGFAPELIDILSEEESTPENEVRMTKLASLARTV